jgi:hypothetical protein
MKSEIRNQKSEIRNQKSENRNQKSEIESEIQKKRPKYNEKHVFFSLYMAYHVSGPVGTSTHVQYGVPIRPPDRPMIQILQDIVRVRLPSCKTSQKLIRKSENY